MPQGAAESCREHRPSLPLGRIHLSVVLLDLIRVA